MGRCQTRHEGTAGGLGRTHEQAQRQGKRPEPDFARGQQQGPPEPDQPPQSDEDGAFWPYIVVEPGEAGGTDPGRYIDGDAEQDHLLEGHAEGPGGVNAAEGEQGVEAVDIDHAGEKKARGLGVSADIAQGVDQCHQTVAQGLHGALATGLVRGPQEQR